MVSALEMFRDEYKRVARLYSATLVSIPGAVLVWELLRQVQCEELASWSKVVIAALGSIAFSFGAMKWFGVMLVSWTGKRVEDCVYRMGTRFPTTELLLWENDVLSHEYKKKVHEQIRKTLNISLLSKKREASSPEEARKTIRDAIDEVRQNVKDGRTVLQYNAHYGFVRNTIGGCFYAFPLSLMLIVAACCLGDSLVVAIGITFAVIYLLPLLFCKRLLGMFANRYAQTLIAEYMALRV